MKGIVLAGGLATRLWPATKSISKQILPIYDKPMIYYPISVLMLCGIREILIISSPEHLPLFQRLLGNGSEYGLSFSYKEQKVAGGLPEALIIGESFLNGENCCLILGDNFLYGTELVDKLKKACEIEEGACIFGCPVKNPQEYGVVEIVDRKVISLEEKPAKPKSHLAAVGLYFFDNRASKLAKALEPSSRGELEITDLLKKYMVEESLSAEIFGRGIVWLDMGVPDRLLEAAHFVQTIQQRQGRLIGCLEEIAFSQKWIDKPHFGNGSKSDYRKYVESL
jgi:glucose-1-phosphate thymidylyltransferase